ncbi:MAG TPA: COX15/CtaA family protein [Phycisphaerales bacterium]|nr:COX15/CtaA family protein [Phycisphaerales bacterium]
MEHQRNEGFGDLLAVALGTSVILWAVAYVGLSPAVNVPGAAMAAFALIGLVLAGVAIGRLTARGVNGGVKVGLLLGFINFLIVASLHGKETTAEALRFGAKWVIAFTVIAVALATLGAWIGSRFPRTSTQPIRWTSRLATIVAITVLPLLVSGGIVTGLEAGLAVPDWLTTFDYPMMFYPMAEMQRVPGVYAEHFHRLWGLLVGLAVILLAVQLHRADSRAWLRWLSIAIILAVIVQGVLGAGWVLSTQLRSLAIMHGVFGQLVFSVIVAVAAFSSATDDPRFNRSFRCDYTLRDAGAATRARRAVPPSAAGRGRPRRGYARAVDAHLPCDRYSRRRHLCCRPRMGAAWRPTSAAPARQVDSAPDGRSDSAGHRSPVCGTSPGAIRGYPHGRAGVHDGPSGGRGDPAGNGRAARRLDTPPAFPA